VQSKRLANRFRLLIGSRIRRLIDRILRMSIGKIINRRWVKIKSSRRIIVWMNRMTRNRVMSRNRNSHQVMMIRMIMRMGMMYCRSKICLVLEIWNTLIYLQEVRLLMGIILTTNRNKMKIIVLSIQMWRWRQRIKI